jgi:hypothetical protein
MDAIATVVTDYLAALHGNRATGATVAETTHYPALTGHYQLSKVSCQCFKSS